MIANFSSFRRKEGVKNLYSPLEGLAIVGSIGYLIPNKYFKAHGFCSA